MRYTPLGWAKKYEFTESDLKVACDMLDTWIDSVAMVIYFLIGNNKSAFRRINYDILYLIFVLSSYIDIVHVFAIIFRDEPIFLQKKFHGMPLKLCFRNVFMEAKSTMSLIRYSIMYLYRRMFDPFMYFHKV